MIPLTETMETTLQEGVLKEEALNKVGHGLHLDGSVFERYSTSEKLVELVRTLGWRDPVLPQSMYIFKQAMIGGEVTAHQDSSFLYTITPTVPTSSINNQSKIFKFRCC